MGDVPSMLMSSVTLREVTLRNRIVMSPMCQYSAGPDGVATDWHLVHYGARAAGGCGLILLEATAVEPRGRISTEDLGLWSADQVPGLRRVAALIRSQGAAAGIQLAHAGRKAFSPAKGQGPQQPVAPSATAYDDGWVVPTPLDRTELARIREAFVQAAVRADAAGFDVVEVHAAHGYLLHEFLSPLANRRADEYGGSLEGRMRFVLEVVSAVRAAWPAGKPLFVRISTRDGVPGGFDHDDAVAVAARLKAAGADVVDCSSGGIRPVRPPEYPGYQLEGAMRVRREAEVAVMAVGGITRPEHAEELLRHGRADLVALGRELLRNPHWPLEAARILGVPGPWPRQYQRARRREDP